MATDAIGDEPSSLYQQAPDDWRAEVIPFPLEFAPEIKLQGVEELRFAPGMFDADSETYFTYTFVWWLEGKYEFSSEALEQLLLSYFQGLYKAVSKQQKDFSQFSVSLSSLARVGEPPSIYAGQIDWIDPFTTEERLLLNLRADRWFCREDEHTAVFFRLSPQPYIHDNWQVMTEQQAGQCRIKIPKGQ